MSVNHQVDKHIIENEIERIRILFEKEKYNLEEKKWFIAGTGSRIPDLWDQCIGRSVLFLETGTVGGL